MRRHCEDGGNDLPRHSAAVQREIAARLTIRAWSNEQPLGTAVATSCGGYQGT